MIPVSPSRTRFTIPMAVLTRTVELLAEPGTQGYEGSALWLGRVITGSSAEVTKVHRPEQMSYATTAGLAVTLTEQGLTDLITSLAVDEIVLARLHTHGNDDVDHSEVDDRNLVVAHPGAVSIVVPLFAANGIDLTSCGVHVLSETHRWHRLTAAEISERFEIR